MGLPKSRAKLGWTKAIAGDLIGQQSRRLTSEDSCVKSGDKGATHGERREEGKNTGKG